MSQLVQLIFLLKNLNPSVQFNWTPNEVQLIVVILSLFQTRCQSLELQNPPWHPLPLPDAAPAKYHHQRSPARLLPPPHYRHRVLRLPPPPPPKAGDPFPCHVAVCPPPQLARSRPPPLRVPPLSAASEPRLFFRRPPSASNPRLHSLLQGENRQRRRVEGGARSSSPPLRPSSRATAAPRPPILCAAEHRLPTAVWPAAAAAPRTIEGRAGRTAETVAPPPPLMRSRAVSDI